MATVAIGDVHGNLAALEDLLGQLRGEVAAGDVVVFLGDYIDRGPDSRGCIDAILTLQREGPAEVVCLRGNHEDWLLRTMNDYGRHSWLMSMEAFETVRSHSPAAETVLAAALADAGLRLFLGKCTLPYDVFFHAVPAEHQQFFRRLACAYGNDDCVCTHAGLDPRVARLGDQAADVCGHWNTAVIDADGWPQPRIAGNTIMLDTISHGVLSAMRFPDRALFQSRRTRRR